MTVHVLAEVTVGSVDTFLAIFVSEGHDKRWEHGCVGAEAFTTTGAEDRVLAMMEFPDVGSFEGFRDDPTAAPIMKKGGAQGPPTFTVLERAASFEH
jgi:hypothetical protein